ncbi:MAG: hydrogenase large subunit [Myxococcales bacterium]
MLELTNGTSAARARIPSLPAGQFRTSIADALRAGARLGALFGRGSGGGEPVLTAVLHDDAQGRSRIVEGLVGGSYPALTTEWPQAQAFERGIFEDLGVVPEGHPWLKPLRFSHLSREPGPPGPVPGAYPYFAVEGEEVHEVAVGPIHAGVIEPGHFRFQCHGERVLHLEIQLGWQHRGIEKLLRGGPTKRTQALIETTAGDTTIGHATAYCELLEALWGRAAPPRAQVIRGVALELERLANHVGDLGALAGDVGFLPSASYLGRLRAEFLNATAELCGSRFGRSLIVPGGVRFDLAAGPADALADRVDQAWKQVEAAAELFFDSASVRGRTDGVGVLTPALAETLGLVGPAARACGLPRDVRGDHPSGVYRFAYLPVARAEQGDVFARAWVRRLEAERSAAFVAQQLRSLPAGPIRVAPGVLAPDRIACSLVEGWRGEICHVALTGADGRFERYDVTDPSVHNWHGLALAMRDGQISDFPLCNKSFNLSYAGHDL